MATEYAHERSARRRKARSDRLGRAVESHSSLPQGGMEGGIPGGRPVALVVDDDEITRLLAKLSLENAGFSVHLARNGVEALAAFDRCRPDLVLMDVLMPEMDGFEACAEIRRHREGGKIPILMMTCLDDVESINRSYEVGATDFVSKPVNWDALRHRSRYVMRASQAVNTAREYQDRYRDLFDMVPVGLFRVSPEGRIIDINRTLVGMGGYADKEQCLSLDLPGIFANPEDCRRFGEIVRERKEVRNYEVRLYRADGEIRWAEINAQAVCDDEGIIRYFDGSLQDITERKEAERVVQERIRLNQMLLDGLPCVALLLRPGTREIVASNRSAVSVDAVPGKTCFSTWGKREDPCPWCLAPAVWAEGKAFHKNVKLPDAVWDAYWIPVADDLYMHFAFDITESRKAEKLLHEKEEQLRQAQKMEVVGRLAGGIAHDFNNFLTAINGYSDLMLSRLGNGDPLRIEVEEIRKAGARAASLTRQLLAYSRRQVLQPKVLDLNAVIVGVESLLKRLIGEHIELRTVLAEDLGCVLADPGRVEQVLMNLVINSRDAMPEGGRLTLETSTIEITRDYVRNDAYVRSGPYVVLSVSDTGCGMDERTKARLFEPFFTTKEVGIGTGLGLTTVYGIVKQSGGYIWCCSEPGKGTSFQVYLPRMDEKPEENPHPSPVPASAQGGTETILVVEDEESVRQLVSHVLKSMGYNVLEAPDGVTGVLRSEHHEGPIHLLVSDIVMPGMTGPEMAGRITQARPGTKVLFMSGYTDGAITRHGPVSEGTSYLEKPFGIERLAGKVRKILDG